MSTRYAPARGDEVIVHVPKGTADAVKVVEVEAANLGTGDHRPGQPGPQAAGALVVGRDREVRT